MVEVGGSFCCGNICEGLPYWASTHGASCLKNLELFMPIFWAFILLQGFFSLFLSSFFDDITEFLGS